MRARRRAGRLYEVPIVICFVLLVLAVVVPRLVPHRGPAAETAPVDSAAAAVGSG